MTVPTVPMSLLIVEQTPLIVVFSVGLGLYSFMSSIAPAIMSELFPTELRARGSVPGTTSRSRCPAAPPHR